MKCRCQIYLVAYFTTFCFRRYRVSLQSDWWISI